MYYEDNLDYFLDYNDNVLKKLQETADYLEIDVKRFSPLDIKAKKHTIGLWDYEGVYTKFKTLGAKRYMATKEEEGKARTEITIAGLPKTAVGYIMKQKDPYKFFEEDMEVPAGCMDIENNIKDKLCFTPIDEETKGIVTDYLGNTSEYEELTSVHSESVGYKLNITEEFIDLITGKLIDERTGLPIYEEPDERLRYTFWR